MQALAAVLERLGHEVDLLGEGEPMLRRLLGGDRPDLVLNFAEGTGGGRSREARVPAVLEMLGIPYTGSDPLTLAVTLDKDCAKRLVAAAGVATPAWALFDGDQSAVAAARAGCRSPDSQAGLRRIEQGNPDDQPGPRSRRGWPTRSTSYSNTIASRCWSKNSSTATS